MSKCRNCNIEILDETVVCPLCHSVLEQTEALENMYPDARQKKQKLMFVCRLYLFCAILVEFILIGICKYFDFKVRWDILSGIGLFYIWLVLRFAIIGKSGYRAKTIVLTLFAVLSAVAIDFSIGYNGWAVDYVISSGILAVDISIIILMICNHRNWQSYIMWQLFMILLSVIPIVLFISGIEKMFIMAVLPAFISVFLFLGTMIIGGRRAAVELKRRFHI